MSENENMFLLANTALNIFTHFSLHIILARIFMPNRSEIPLKIMVYCSCTHFLAINRSHFWIDPVPRLGAYLSQYFSLIFSGRKKQWIQPELRSVIQNNVGKSWSAEYECRRASHFNLGKYGLWLKKSYEPFFQQ